MTISQISSGGGVFALDAPASASNRTIVLPDASTTLVGTDATQTLTNKTIDAVQLSGNVAASRITNALNASGSAPMYACRAWVNFNGTGTVAIRASGNVSSITDNGTGDYTVNFTTAMPDANYSAVVTPGINSGSGVSMVYLDTVSAGSVRVNAGYQPYGGGAGFYDCAIVSVAIFR